MAPPSKAPSSELGVVCLDLRSKDGSERATVEMRVPSASGAYDAVMKRYMAIFDPKKSKRQTRADAPYRSHAEPKIWRQQIMVDGGYDKGGATVYQKILSKTGDVSFIQTQARSIARHGVHKNDDHCVVARFAPRNRSQSPSHVVEVEEVSDGRIVGRGADGTIIPLHLQTAWRDDSIFPDDTGRAPPNQKHMRWVKRSDAKKYRQPADKAKTKTTPVAKAHPEDEYRCVTCASKTRSVSSQQSTTTYTPSSHVRGSASVSTHATPAMRAHHQTSTVVSSPDDHMLFVGEDRYINPGSTALTSKRLHHSISPERGMFGRADRRGSIAAGSEKGVYRGEAPDVIRDLSNERIGKWMPVVFSETGATLPLPKEAPLFKEKGPETFARCDLAPSQIKPSDGVDYYTMCSDGSFVEVHFVRSDTILSASTTAPHHSWSTFQDQEVAAATSFRAVDSTGEQDGGIEERVTVVEVPQIQERIREVPKKVVEYIEKRVPKYEVQCVERIVEVPQYEHVERVEEYDDVQEKSVRVTKKIVVDVPRDVIKYVPKIERRIIEQIIEVPNVIEKRVAQVVEKRVNRVNYRDIEVPVVVAQILQPILVQDEGESECVQECADYVPDIIPVDVFIPKPVHAPAEVGGNFTEHAEVQIPVTQWNGLLDRLNPHLDQTAKELLPYRQVTSAVQLMTNN
eukprot:Lankesteria_metandrocarpae@DN1518_c0_g1_i1.p1